MLRKGTDLSKVSRNKSKHLTRLKLRKPAGSRYYVVSWESDSFWKSAADCESTIFLISFIYYSFFNRRCIHFGGSSNPCF